MKAEASKREKKTPLKEEKILLKDVYVPTNYYA